MCYVLMGLCNRRSGSLVEFWEEHWGGKEDEERGGMTDCRRAPSPDCILGVTPLSRNSSRHGHPSRTLDVNTET